MVGDTHSAALVAADGTVDWWCPSRFDAAPLLTRLLDPPGACVRIGPWAPGRPAPGTQRYRDGSLVLVTTLAGRDSLMEVTDFLPWEGGQPTGRLVRRVRVLRGWADVVVEVVPTGDPRDIAVWSEGMAFDGCVVRCGHPFLLGAVPPPAPARPLRRLVATASVRLDTGEGLVVTVEPPGSDEGPLAFDAAGRLADRTATAWRRVHDRVDVSGPHADAAARSLLVLTALSGAHGAPVSSPVTSLPRVIGGERNTDGRVVSPVAAAAWASVATGCGLAEEADAASTWLAGAIDHDPPLPSALAVDGSGPATEAHRSELAGWRRSQPVVTGTNAPDRISVEPASAVVAAAAALASMPVGGALLARWDRVAAHADWLADHWDGQDASVWDLRGTARPWVSTRLASRHALASAAASARRRSPLDLDAAAWHVAARDIERWLVSSAVGPGGVIRPLAAEDTGTTDASLVRVADWGPWPADDEVVGATIDRVISRNGHGPWVYPWPTEVDDGLPGSEPASVTATLWVARALALAERWDEAHERMDAAVNLAGPLHLLPESVDAQAGVGLGNMPSSAAHLALVDAALALQRAPR
jgi:hypothetical protein